MTDFQQPAFYLNIAGEILLVYRLAVSRLLGVYRYFALYLLYSAVTDLAGTRFSAKNMSADGYIQFWSVTVSVGAILLVAAVLELYNLIIRKFIGIGKWGAWILAGAAGVGIAIAALVGLVDANAIDLHKPLTAIAYSKRWILSAIAVLLLVSSWFFFRFKPMLTRNLVVHSRILTAYCVVLSAEYLALNLGVRPALAGTLELTACSVCYGLWIILLSRKGEESTALPVSAAEAERARRLQERITGALGLPRPERDDGGDPGVEQSGD